MFDNVCWRVCNLCVIVYFQGCVCVCVFVCCVSVCVSVCVCVCVCVCVRVSVCMCASRHWVIYDRCWRSGAQCHWTQVVAYVLLLLMQLHQCSTVRSVHPSVTCTPSHPILPNTCVEEHAYMITSSRTRTCFTDAATTTAWRSCCCCCCCGCWVAGREANLLL